LVFGNNGSMGAFGLGVDLVFHYLFFYLVFWFMFGGEQRVSDFGVDFRCYTRERDKASKAGERMEWESEQ
jgi:hypothetical protein